MKKFNQFIKEAKYSYGGDTDKDGGNTRHYTASDGTSQSVYIPGRKPPESSGYGHEPSKPEPKHPLQGKKVTDGKIHGRLMGTEHQGTVAKIKHPDTGAIHYVDAKNIKKHSGD